VITIFGNTIHFIANITIVLFLYRWYSYYYFIVNIADTATELKSISSPYYLLSYIAGIIASIISILLSSFVRFRTW